MTKKKLFPLCRTFGGYSKDAYDAWNFSNFPDYSTLKAARFVPFWGGMYYASIWWSIASMIPWNFQNWLRQMGAFLHTHTHTPKKSINNYPKSPEPSKLPIEDLYTPASYRLSHQKPLEGPIAVFLRVETVIPRSVTWKFNTSPPWSINFPKFPSSKREGGLKSKFFIQGILLMAEIHRNRLRLVFYPIIFRVLTSQVVV